MSEGGAENFNQRAEETLSAGVFAESEKYRRKLRLVQNTIRNISDILAIEEKKLKELQGSEDFWPQKVEALEKRMAEQEGKLAELKENERELKKILAGYPEAYRDPGAHLLDQVGPGLMDN